MKFKTSTSGVAMASFRLASTPRFFNRAEGGWSDRPTTWFTVECWRGLAENVNESLVSGQPVLVTGRLKTAEWVDKEGQTQSRSVIDAYSVGHDLSRGTAIFHKSPPKTNQQPDSLRDEMRELVDDVENEEDNPFHVDDGAPFATALGLAADSTDDGVGGAVRAA